VRLSSRIIVSDLLATPASPAFGEMDLLTAIMHEFGHVLGLAHLSGTVMSPVLDPGERLTPGLQQAKVQDSHPVAPPSPAPQVHKSQSGNKQLALVFDEWHGEFVQPGNQSPDQTLSFGLVDAGTPQTNTQGDWIIDLKKLH
jgi:hypothetical protein